MSETQLDLERFVAAIAWSDPDWLDVLFCSYVEVLVERFAQFVASQDSNEQRRLLTALDLASPPIGPGDIGTLLWPPVSRVILGRTEEACDSDSLARQIASALPAPFSVVGVPIWISPNIVSRGWISLTEVETRIVYEALTYIKEFGVDIADFVTSATRVCCNVRAASSLFGSWSTDELIGCTVLVNPQCAMHPLEVAEQLVHEAIHHAQAMLETRRPFIQDTKLVKMTIRYQSPWTGALLTAKSLLAATFVWFGLAYFWERVEASMGPIATAHRRRAIQGFSNILLERDIASFAWALDPELPNVIAQMRTQVIKRWNSVD